MCAARTRIALNAERAAEEARGLVRWLRPEFQNPTIAGTGTTRAPEQALLTVEHGTDGDDPAAPATVTTPSKPQPWPKDPVAQVKAVADVLANSPVPLDTDGVATRFKGSGAWKRRLPHLRTRLVERRRQTWDGWSRRGQRSALADVRGTPPSAHPRMYTTSDRGRTMNVDELQTFLEGRSPEGVGFAFRLDALGRAVQRMLTRLQNHPSDGVNRNLPLPIAEVAASFSVDPASFRMDGLSGAISLQVDLWLHQAGDPATPIYEMAYRLQDEAVVAGTDPAAQRVFLEPGTGARAQIHGQSWGADADVVLVRLGYVDSVGLADRPRFHSEVITPFLWLNARGLLRAIIRSFPVPDVFSWFETIRPQGAIVAEMGAGYLIAWSELAAIAIPDCALPPRQGPGPSVVPDAVTGVPKPWSTFDQHAPGLMLYYAAAPLLDWHAGVFMPAVAFHQEHDGFPGWSVDGHAGVQRLRVRFEPRADGGALTFDAELRVLGHASSWINGPCGLRLDVGTATFSGPGSLQGELAVSYSRARMALRSALTVAVDVPAHTLNLSAGGLLGGAWIEILEWLLRAGVVRLDLSMQSRSEQTLLDLLQQSVDHGAANALKRVAERSVAIALDWDVGQSPPASSD